MLDDLDLDELDPLHERHYATREVFVALLRALGYQVSFDGHAWAEIHLDARAHPLVAYDLADYVKEALDRGLFNAQVVGTSGEGDPLEVTLGWEADEGERLEPLHTRMTYPVDYFLLAEEPPRVLLRYDFDSEEGIALTNRLLHDSLVYVDEMGVEGPLEELEEHLREVWPAELPAFEAACEDDEPAALTPFWLNYFNYFSLAQDVLGEHVVVHCVGPHDRGYVGDRMYFLMYRHDFDDLEVPLSYRVALN